MADSSTLTGELGELFADVIGDVDETIGENRDYGAGIGPHDEDDQVDALAAEVRASQAFDGELFTVKSDSGEVRYPNGQSADLVVEKGDRREYCEAKLFRFQKANGDPSPRGFSKVFSPYQDHSPRSFIHDVRKIAESDIRAAKTFLGLYYRPVQSAGAEITGGEIAEKFAADVDRWTDFSLTVDTVSSFDDLQHEVLRQGAIITWALEDQPKQWF